MSFTEGYKQQLLTALDTLDLPRVEQAIRWFEEVRDQGRQIFTCGNGGSASTASHFVTDMVKGASFGKEKRFRIHALTDSLATLTAYSNDVSYDAVFVEQLKNFAQPGDILLAISGSGNSPNVLRAVAASVRFESNAMTYPCSASSPIFFATPGRITRS